MLDNSRSVENLIESHRECNKKDKCNCFNSNPSIICGDARICSIIKYYENILNEDIIERPPNKVIKKVKVKVKKPTPPPLEKVHETKQ